MIGVAWAALGVLTAVAVGSAVMLRSEIGGLRSEMNAMEGRLSAQIGEVRDDLRSQREILSRHLEAHAAHPA